MTGRPTSRFRRRGALATGAAALASLGSTRLPRARAAGQLPPGQLALLFAGGLWLANADGRQRQLVAPTGYAGWLQDPAWSPDGTLLAYTDVRWPANAFQPGAGTPWPIGEVYTVAALDPQATPQRLVTQQSEKEVFVSAAWAPDGAALYVVRRRPAPGSAVDAVSDLLRVDATTGESQVLDLGISPSEVAVARDGTLAVVGVPKPGMSGIQPDRLYLVSPNGVPAEVASAAPETGLESITLLRFAPDGRLAFAAGSGGLPAVLRDAAPATGPHVAHAHGVITWPWAFDPSTGGLRRTSGPGFDDLAGLAWSGDGNQLLVLDVNNLALVQPNGARQPIPEVKGYGLAWFPGS